MVLFLIHAVDEGKTIDHNYYIENCLKPVIKEIWKQRKSNGTKGIKLLHDNARPHRHSDIIDYSTEEGINIMPYPPYSSDLAPCDYWLNDYIKRNLTDQPNEKSLGLERDGLTTWMWTGSYRIPMVTLTGSLQQDLLLIDKVIGAGELALSDHRSSWPSKSDLVQLLSDARVAGMLSGKIGVVHFHLGSAPTKIDLLWQILNETTIPIQHMYLTHMSSRGDDLIEEARKWIKAGGMCDFTADVNIINENATVNTLNKFRAEKLPLKQITVSSDAYGSFPKYDSSGRLASYGMSLPDTILRTIQTLVLKYSWPVEEAIQFSTSNPATYLNLTGKGFLAEGYDADIVVLNQTDLTPFPTSPQYSPQSPASSPRTLHDDDLNDNGDLMD
ncbi:unnamed protein product [Rotaria sordida]|uniref:dihydropyrimidinase n=1 Tax=Rotaria sordida TaxID=392033 RepID=A0A819MH79_9BILA|nr:unnamed protein product [Rotaria sordida]